MPNQIDDATKKENIAERSSSNSKSESAADIDRELVLRAQSGDTEAFGDLVDKHQRMVYGIVSRMIYKRDEVDDIVQDIFVSAWRAIGGFKGNAKFSTWLHTITVNTTIKRLKSMKKETRLSFDDKDTGLADVAAADESESPLANLQRNERSRAIKTAIESLPEKQKLVIVLHYYEHYSCDEIASILECSTGTVWSRLHYACKSLKTQLKWLIKDK